MGDSAAVDNRGLVGDEETEAAVQSQFRLESQGICGP
jgi:hypothetical protein